MTGVDGFEVAFTHRGSWKAALSAPSMLPDTIPVAWKSDYLRTDGQWQLFIWFKDPEEVNSLMSAGGSFRVALATKNEDGSTASKNIIGVFWVTPVSKSPSPRLGLHCLVESRAKIPGLAG